ncbi:MAG: hypothetical protein ABI832_03315 [bacterium]
MTRDEAQALLPFHANGSLTGAEADAVAQALAEDPGLRQDLAALVALRQAMQDTPVQSPGEFGLARLMRAVEREAPAPRRFSLWQAVAAVAVIVALGQAIYIGSRPNGPAVTLAGDDSGPGLTVAFAPNATMQAISGLLTAQGLQVVDGPSALGLWRVTGDDLPAASVALAASPLVEDVEPGPGDGKD